MRLPESVDVEGVLLALSAGVVASLACVLATLLLGLGAPGYVASVLAGACVSASLDS